MYFNGTFGDDVLIGGVGNDTIQGGFGNDTLLGDGGNDSISGGFGDDFLFGGGQGDKFFSVGGSDTLEGGEGDDAHYIVLSTGGGSVIRDEQGEFNIVFIYAENTNLDVLSNLEYNPNWHNLINDPNTWGDAAIEISHPRPGIVGLGKSGTNLIVDINRDGIAEAASDLTIVNYFDTQGNLGAGAPRALNNIYEEQQEVVQFFANNPSFEDVYGAGDNSGTTVYRFFNKDTGVHFYTASIIERNSVHNKLPNYTYEGASYKGVDYLSGANYVPVYRFLNQETGAHLYTTSEVERNAVEDLAHFSYEGRAFFAHASQVEGTIPIYRFFNTHTGAHFYTPSELEKDYVLDNLPEFQSEGIAYYALPNDIDF